MVVRSSIRFLGTLAVLWSGARPLHAAVPTSWARNYDSIGIGMVLGAGPVLASRHGTAPNQILAQGWFHYFPTVIGGAGMELSSRIPSRLESYTQARYDVTSTWIPWHDPVRAVELSLIGSLVNTKAYLDTLIGTDPIEDIGSDLGLSLRGGFGHRATPRFGWWASGAPFVAFRALGDNAGVNLGLDMEVGVVYSMSEFWHDSKKLSRAWDVFLRFPVRFESASPHVTATGIHRGPAWSIGAQLGPSVLF
ncbi:MAG TPA: hypothetical protein PK208_14685 [Fibrobacteria bacterium]|nr:hypothetical protein [Fibrobacteria bacterium]